MVTGSTSSGPAEHFGRTTLRSVSAILPVEPTRNATSPLSLLFLPPLGAGGEATCTVASTTTPPAGGVGGSIASDAFFGRGEKRSVTPPESWKPLRFAEPLASPI